MLESRVEGKFVELCEYKTVKMNPDGQVGVPDRGVLIGKGIVLFLEFKRPKHGVLSPMQKNWLKQLRLAGYKAESFNNTSKALHWVDMMVKEYRERGRL